MPRRSARARSCGAKRAHASKAAAAARAAPARDDGAVEAAAARARQRRRDLLRRRARHDSRHCDGLARGADGAECASSRVVGTSQHALRSKTRRVLRAWQRGRERRVFRAQRGVQRGVGGAMGPPAAPESGKARPFSGVVTALTCLLASDVAVAAPRCRPLPPPRRRAGGAEDVLQGEDRRV
jgi:hypothetical protein